ncbi:hypothetical protein N9E86_01240 [Alphaproteobacteria bacterium]|nr:hypothetical protein [Alphaproteobacteria bacterium]
MDENANRPLVVEQSSQQIIGWVALLLSLTSIFAPPLALLALPVGIVAIRRGNNLMGWISVVISGLYVAGFVFGLGGVMWLGTIL